MNMFHPILPNEASKRSPLIFPGQLQWNICEANLTCGVSKTKPQEVLIESRLVPILLSLKLGPRSASASENN
jgi:hypothetical protein